MTARAQKATVGRADRGRAAPECRTPARRPTCTTVVRITKRSLHHFDAVSNEVRRDAVRRRSAHDKPPGGRRGKDRGSSSTWVYFTRSGFTRFPLRIAARWRSCSVRSRTGSLSVAGSGRGRLPQVGPERSRGYVLRVGRRAGLGALAPGVSGGAPRAVLRLMPVRQPFQARRPAAAARRRRSSSCQRGGSTRPRRIRPSRNRRLSRPCRSVRYQTAGRRLSP